MSSKTPSLHKVFKTLYLSSHRGNYTVPLPYPPLNQIPLGGPGQAHDDGKGMRVVGGRAGKIDLVNYNGRGGGEDIIY